MEVMSIFFSVLKTKVCGDFFIAADEQKVVSISVVLISKAATTL
jgi:hypothetical protein